jgi:hypothetical protein
LEGLSDRIQSYLTVGDTFPKLVHVELLFEEGTHLVSLTGKFTFIASWSLGDSTIGRIVQLFRHRWGRILPERELICVCRGDRS